MSREEGTGRHPCGLPHQRLSSNVCHATSVIHLRDESLTKATVVGAGLLTQQLTGGVFRHSYHSECKTSFSMDSASNVLKKAATSRQWWPCKDHSDHRVLPIKLPIKNSKK